MREAFDRNHFFKRRSTKLTWLVTVFFITLCLTGCQSMDFGMLNPKGIITLEERKLFFDTLALMLIVVIPVIIMSFAFVYHYQISHRVRDYKPNWAHSYLLESLWWTIPLIIVLILGILTWKKTHELDPFRPIAGLENQTPQLIQAIALPWKWLFIYPNENIATINYLVLPVGQQVEYWITADNVPMSAFFIPQLGSQIYAMAGMRTRLHLLANEPGDFKGLNTQYNGDGFSDMFFEVHVVPPESYQQWIGQMKTSSSILTESAYIELLKPTIGDPPKFFSGVPTNLFQNIINAYMHTFGPIHPRNNFASGNPSILPEESP